MHADATTVICAAADRHARPPPLAHLQLTGHRTLCRWSRASADERDMPRRRVQVVMRVRHAEEVALVVRQASEEAKPVVRRLLELNAYEFSAING